MSQPNREAEIAQAVADGYIEIDGEWGKNPAAVALGSIKSKKKAKSSRINGRLGGRPKTKGITSLIQ